MVPEGGPEIDRAYHSLVLWGGILCLISKEIPSVRPTRTALAITRHELKRDRALTHPMTPLQISAALTHIFEFAATSSKSRRTC